MNVKLISSSASCREATQTPTFDGLPVQFLCAQVLQDEGEGSGDAHLDRRDDHVALDTHLSQHPVQLLNGPTPVAGRSETGTRRYSRETRSH